MQVEVPSPPPSPWPVTTASARWGMHRIEICVRPENVKSLRVVEKIGMTEEGLRHQYLHIDGSWRDHRVFRMFPDDHPQGVLHDLQRNFPAPGMSCGSTASRL